MANLERRVEALEAKIGVDDGRPALVRHYLFTTDDGEVVVEGCRIRHGEAEQLPREVFPSMEDYELAHGPLEPLGRVAPFEHR